MMLISRAVPLWSSALVAVGLAGCAAAPAHSDAHDHARMGRMDPQAMCEMHKKMMSGKAPAQQQALMQEHMKSMTPEMRQQMQSIHEQCT
ncbi:hypothetical protein WG922_09105 [Ramlibacter sp. AN1015]|uniref:hypothetical protein n=1 Tax=Ramlibacter sp. AN1015 TaxID=3133428 RepID=UPI0030C026B5